MGHSGIIVQKVSAHAHAVKLAALPTVPERTQTPDPNTHALGSPMGRQTWGGSWDPGPESVPGLLPWDRASAGLRKQEERQPS